MNKYTVIETVMNGLGVICDEPVKDKVSWDWLRMNQSH